MECKERHSIVYVNKNRTSLPKTNSNHTSETQEEFPLDRSTIEQTNLHPAGRHVGQKQGTSQHTVPTLPAWSSRDEYSAMFFTNHRTYILAICETHPTP